MGLFCGWSVDAELTVRLHERGVRQQRHVQTTLNEEAVLRCNYALYKLTSTLTLTLRHTPTFAVVEHIVARDTDETAKGIIATISTAHFRTFINV